MATTTHTEDVSPVREALPILASAASAPLSVVGAGITLARQAGASFAVPCPLLEITGLPCPFCGIGRASGALASFDWSAAAQQVPAVLVVFVMGAMTLLVAAGTRRRRLPSVRASVRYLAVLGVLLAANWVFQISQTLGGG